MDHRRSANEAMLAEWGVGVYAYATPMSEEVFIALYGYPWPQDVGSHAIVVFKADGEAFALMDDWESVKKLVANKKLKLYVPH
jgi:hypothetical protein